MSDSTTTTTNTTTTPQVDEANAVEPTVDAGAAAASVVPEKTAEATPAAVNVKVENENKSVEQDQPKMDTSDIPADNETKPAGDTQEKPATEATDKSVLESQEKPTSAVVAGGEAGDKPADQSSKVAEPVAAEMKEDVKPAVDADKVVEADKVAETEKSTDAAKAAAATEEKAMKVDEEPAKEVETPVVAPEQPQPPKQNDLPTRQYLDATVVPILHSALSQLAKIRPDDPIQYLCKFLQEQKSNFAPDQKWADACTIFEWMNIKEQNK